MEKKSVDHKNVSKLNLIFNSQAVVITWSEMCSSSIDVPDTSTKNERVCRALSSKCLASTERTSSCKKRYNIYTKIQWFIFVLDQEGST